MKTTRRFVEEMLSGRTALLELLLAGFLLALSVEFMSASGLEMFSVPEDWLPLAGLLLAVITILLFFWRFSRSVGVQTVSLEGFLIYLKKSNTFVRIPRYTYGFLIHQYLQSAFTENSALKTLWNKEPLWNKGSLVEQNTESMKLVHEATEYFLLTYLSIHLTDYFNDIKFGKNRLKEYYRDNIPDILLKNRFMELFSRPMDQRPHFVDDLPLPPYLGTIVSSGRGGARYERFNLILPRNSTITRNDDGTIKIETSKFVLNFLVDFSTVGTNLPHKFEEFYLGLKDLDEYYVYEVGIKIHTIFKILSLFSWSGWEYNKWIDSFINYLDLNFSKEQFIKDLNWSTVLTLIEVINIGESNKGLQVISKDASKSGPGGVSEAPER